MNPRFIKTETFRIRSQLIVFPFKNLGDAEMSFRHKQTSREQKNNN